MLVVSLSAIRTAGRAFLGPNIPNWISVRLFPVRPIPHPGNEIIHHRRSEAGGKQLAKSSQTGAGSQWCAGHDAGWEGPLTNGFK